MLVLLNLEVIDVGDPIETLTRWGVDLRQPPTLPELVALGRSAAFAGRGLERVHVGLRQSLAAMLATTDQVNCAKFACPEAANSAREVVVRLAQAPILTLADLWAAQRDGLLSPDLIEQHVWRVAPAGAAA